MNKFQESLKPFYKEVLASCERIVTMSGGKLDVVTHPTEYVLNGQTYALVKGDESYVFWLGVNGPRLFFIVYIAGLTPDEAKEKYEFCFGGATAVGWKVNYQAIDRGVSIWATCMTDQYRPLVVASPNATSGLSNDPVYQLTEEGQFWATDIGMMAQSWVRTSERNGIKCHNAAPAPL